MVDENTMVEEDISPETIEMEGQEAILVEEEATVKKEDVTPSSGGSKKKKKPKKRRSLFGKPQTIEAREEESPEVTVSGTKSRVVLIDSTNQEEAQKEDLSTNQEAARKVDISRSLLQAALRQYDQTNIKIDENARGQMTRVAFQQAAEARRLVEGDNDDLETVISQNTSKGEAAAARACSILEAGNVPPSVSAKAGEDGNAHPPKERGSDSSENDVKKEDELPAMYTPQDIFNEAQVYVTKARQHLEAILPVLECVPADHRSTQVHPFVPTSGIETDGDNYTLSTLGFDNTFQETLLSITSLNEILDAPISPLRSEEAQPNTAPTEKEGETGRKGRFSWFGKKAQQKPESTDRGGIQVQDTQAVPAPESSKSATEGPKSVLIEEDRPVERFIASVVENEEEESVCSDASNKSELEHLMQLDERTDSKIKEAMAVDRTNSLTSWDGVPLFDLPEPDEEKKKHKTKKSKKKDQKNETTDEQEAPRSSNVGKPQFVEAPEYDPKVLQSQSLDHMFGEGQWNENENEDIAPPVTEKKKKWGLMGWRKHTADKSENVSVERTITDDLDMKQNGDDPAHGGQGQKGQPQLGTNSSTAELNEIKAPSILSKEEVGDRYTAFSADDDSFNETAKDRLQNKEPIVTDVDLMPEQPEPTDIRLVSSLDADKCSIDDSEDVKFADVEIGTDQVEKKIMSRKSVIKKIKAVRKPRDPTKVAAVPKVHSFPEGVSEVEASTSMIAQIEKQKKGKKNDSRKGGKQGKQSRLSWLKLGKDARNTHKPEISELSVSDSQGDTEDSNPPAMSLVTTDNTESSSECAQDGLLGPQQGNCTEVL